MKNNKKLDKKIEKRIENRLKEAKKQLEKGVKAHKSKDFEKALNHFQHSLEIIHEILTSDDFIESKYDDVREGKILTLIHLGNVHHHLKETDRALEYLHEALKLEDEKGMVGDMRARVTMMYMIGEVYCDQEDWEQAVDTFEKLYYLMVRVNAPFDDTAKVLDNLTTICYEHLEKDDPRTPKFFEKAIELLKIMGRKRGVRNMINNLAVFHYRNGEFDKALDYYQQALELDENLKDIKGKSSRLRYIGSVYFKKEDWDQALKYYAEAVELSDQIEDFSGKEEGLKKLGELYMVQGNEEKAQEYFREAEQVNMGQ